MMRRVYRVESFIEHQDTCNASRQARAEAMASSPASGGGAGGGLGVAAASSSQQQQQSRQVQAAAALSRTASSASPSSGGDLVVSPVAWPGPAGASSTANAAAFHRFDPPAPLERRPGVHNLELQLMPPHGGCADTAHPAVGYCASPHCVVVPQRGADPMQLHLSIGVGGGAMDDTSGQASASAAARLKKEAREQLRLATAQKAAAEEARAQARRQAELAEQELASARRIRQQAQAELGRAHALRDHAVRQVDATLLQVTCYSCRTMFRARAAAMSSEVASYVSSVVTEGGDVEVDNDDDLQLVNADDPHGRMDLN
jgi:hypothetical protein